MKKIVDNKRFDQSLEEECEGGMYNRTSSRVATFFFRRLGSSFICIRILKQLRKKYSTNELALLEKAWAVEHFNYYLYGKSITIITDHQSPLSALSALTKSKAVQSQLIRCNDRICLLILT